MENNDCKIGDSSNNQLQQKKSGKKPPLFTRKTLIMLLYPLVIEQILAVTVGMADTIMVANVGEYAVSSVSVVDNINMLMIQIFTAMSAGGSVIIAQYIGRGDLKNANLATKQLLYAGLSLTLVITAFSLIFNNQILNLIYQKLDTDVMTSASKYYYITAASYPFLLIYNVGASLYRVMGNSKTPMKISLLINVINITGNYTLINIAHLGAVGAAWSTMASRVTGSILLFMLACRKTNSVYIDKPFSYRPDFTMIKSILRLGIPNGIENGIFQVGKLMVMSIITGFGTASIAANAASGSLSGLAMIPGSAIGIAMITVVGQCVGAGEYKQAVSYTYKFMLTMIGSIAVLNIALFFAAETLSGFFGLSPEALKLSSEVIKIYAIVTPFFWPTSFGLPNALRAAGDAKFTMAVSVASMWIFRIGFSFILARYMNLGLHGVWIAMYIDWVVRTIFYVIRYVRGKWKSIRVI
jgi:putative MATE family efflux protein